MSKTTTLPQISPIIIDANLETELTEPNKNVTSTKSAFDTLLLDAIDSAFSTIGCHITQVVYSHLKNKFGINREEIPNDVESFVNALEMMFGQGSMLIEIQIIRYLQLKVPQYKFAPKQDQLYLVSYLEHIRSCMAEF